MEKLTQRTGFKLQIKRSLFLRAILTRDNITGTSTNTPTTVANVAPEDKPNRLIEKATASSKKLDAPISADGAAMLYGTFKSLEIENPTKNIK